MISIIIPANNEEKVIATALNELVDGAANGELEVIVVCNGCTDNTAQVVASFGSAIRCIKTEIASKANALNLGDAAANSFPRFYQDADVVLSLDAVRLVAQVLRSGRFLAAAPRMHIDLRKASWPVRAYYEVWQQLPYVREGMIGVGIYALSREGRNRFLKFPEIIADDGYIRALFQTNERTSVDSCHSLVRAPASLAGLLKIKTRSRLGRYELKMKFPELIQNEEKHYSNALFGLLSQAHLLTKLPVYLLVNLLTRFRARRYARLQGFTGWERDDSSRSIA
jgi:glycosyltransferase involved in cell wall biosynthesis